MAENTGLAKSTGRFGNSIGIGRIVLLNKELANAFNLMADLLEIQGANRFRINSFRRTGRTLKDLVEDASKRIFA